MLPRELSEARRNELRDVHAALVRAAAYARQVAIDTDTGIVVVRDGKLVRISAAELRKGAV